MDFDDTLKVSASALNAQTVRLRTIAENLANANSTAKTPGGDPYRRKVVSFRDEMDRQSGADLVKVSRMTLDSSPFELRYDPANPGADQSGYVRMPNVNTLVEMADLKEAQQSYQANIDVVDAAKQMMSRAVDLLKS